jgi:hypothetical protein
MDGIQNRLQNLQARVDTLVNEMNGFVVEIRGQLCELLDAKIVTPTGENHE